MNRFLSIIWVSLLVVLPAGSLFMTGIFKRELILFAVSLCSLLTLVLGYAKRLEDKRAGTVITKVDFILAIFVMYAIVRGAFQGFEQIDPLVWLQWGTVVWVYLAMRMVNNLKVFFWALLVSTSVQSLVAIGQKVGSFWSLHSQFDVTGTLGNPGQLGGFIAIGSIIALAMLVESVNSRNKLLIIIYSLVLLLNMTGLYLSDSRAGWVVTLVGGFILLRKHIKSLVKVRNGMFIAIVLSLTLIAFLPILDYRPASVLARILIYINTLSMAIRSPLFGSGFGSFEKGYMLEQANYFIENPNSVFVSVADNVAYPYNELLHLFVVFGIVGVVLALLIIYLIFRTGCSDSNNRTIKASLVVWIVFSMFSYPSYVYVLLIVFAVLLGLSKSEAIFRLKRGCWRGFIPILFFFVSGVYIKEYLYLRGLSRKTLFEECNVQNLKTIHSIRFNLLRTGAKITQDSIKGGRTISYLRRRTIATWGIFIWDEESMIKPKRITDWRPQ